MKNPEYAPAYNTYTKGWFEIFEGLRYVRHTQKKCF